MKGTGNERKDELVKWKKWRGEGGGEEAVMIVRWGSTTISKNLTIDTKRERIHVFSGGQTDAFESIPRLIHPFPFVSPVAHSPLPFEELRRAIATEKRRSIRRFAMLTETLRVTESFESRKTSF